MLKIKRLRILKDAKNKKIENSKRLRILKDAKNKKIENSKRS
jgi:hypothetical protein